MLVAEDGLRREARADAFVEMLKSPFLSLGIVAPTLKADVLSHKAWGCAQARVAPDGWCLRNPKIEPQIFLKPV